MEWNSARLHVQHTEYSPSVSSRTSLVAYGTASGAETEDGIDAELSVPVKGVHRAIKEAFTHHSAAFGGRRSIGA